MSDPLGLTAQGLETIENKGSENVLQALQKVCGQTHARQIVIGLPVNMNGTLGPRAKQVLDLVPKLQMALGVPVKTWDERLSSRQAGRLMIEEGLSRAKQKTQSDRLAATLILQGYLESQRAKP